MRLLEYWMQLTALRNKTIPNVNPGVIKSLVEATPFWPLQSRLSGATLTNGNQPKAFASLEAIPQQSPGWSCIIQHRMRFFFFFLPWTLICQHIKNKKKNEHFTRIYEKKREELQLSIMCARAIKIVLHLHVYQYPGGTVYIHGYIQVRALFWNLP